MFSSSLASINEEEKKLFGFYRGTVLKHLTFGKCKVYIHGVYDPTLIDTPDLIPDAEQAAGIFGGCNTGNGIFSYPNIGATVWCFFANGDQNYPVFFASTLGGDNAFGQYEIIMPPRTRQNLDTIKSEINESLKKNSKISSLNTSEYIVSDKHLITAKNTQLEFYESGILSAIVRDPYQNDAIVNHNTSQFQYDQQFDSVSCYPAKNAVDENKVNNSNCQFVLNNIINGGEVFASTHQHYVDPANNQIIINADNSIKFSNDNCITLSSETHDTRGINANAYIKVNSKSPTINEYIQDNANECEITIKKHAGNGKIDIKIQPTNGSSGSIISLDKQGNITLNAKCITINAASSMELTSPSININSTSLNINNSGTTIKAPIVTIDTSAGNTIIKSTLGTHVL